MLVYRTPESAFDASRRYFPYEPQYTNVAGPGEPPLMMASYETGNVDAEEVALLLHGEPTWSFLYRHMAPALASKGFLVLMPDVIGMGRSDKPTDMSIFSYAQHTRWLASWMLQKVAPLVTDPAKPRLLTIFCQDWGSLLGLRAISALPQLAARIVIGNGGLPTGHNPIPRAFHIWRLSSWYSPIFPVSWIVQLGTKTQMSKDEKEAYDAPFVGNSASKAAVRSFPQFVPIKSTDPSTPDIVKAWDLVYTKWKKPLLTAFSTGDPITRGGEAIWKEKVPGAQGRKHSKVAGGHFLQQDSGEQLAQIFAEFAQETKDECLKNWEAEILRGEGLQGVGTVDGVPVSLKGGIGKKPEKSKL